MAGKFRAAGARSVRESSPCGGSERAAPRRGILYRAPNHSGQSRPNESDAVQTTTRRRRSTAPPLEERARCWTHFFAATLSSHYVCGYPNHGSRFQPDQGKAHSWKIEIQGFPGNGKVL